MNWGSVSWPQGWPPSSTRTGALIHRCSNRSGNSLILSTSRGRSGLLSWLKGGLPAAKFDELRSLSFIERKENVILLGPSGVGKTHLMLGLGHKACMTGYSAYYISCRDAIERLLKAREQNRLRKALSWFRKPHVLLVDEVGHEPLTAEQANVFFQLVNVRYETGPIIMTSNRPFSKWAELMSDEAVATAMLDRLLHHAQVISLKADSYRMKERLRVGAVGFD